MAKLTWDDTGKKIYETGTKKGVLFVVGSDGQYGNGVAWNGLTAITESPSGADESAFYADDIKYASLRAAEEFGGTIEAYTYPDEWEACDGSATLTTGVVIGQQKRATFGMSYVTTIGNDTLGYDYGYKIHLIYGATASPSERAYQTINDSPELITFSWEFTTVPVNVSGDFKPVACLTIDSTKFTTAEDKAKLDALERALYGCDADATNNITAQVSHLPLPDDVKTILTTGTDPHPVNAG